MLKSITAAYLMTTALTIAPALAQTHTPDTSSAQHSTQNVSTQSFVTKAAEGGMFEIQSSQLALKKSQDKDVQEFAKRMIHDHTAADDKLKSIAKNEKIPSSLDQEHEKMLSKLQGESGSNFVDQYKQMQVDAHQQTIDMFQDYAQNGDDKPIKQFAEQTLPTLKEHLQMAQQITVASNDGNHDQQTAANTATSNGGDRHYITQETAGTWRASKMIGLGVYNEQNQKVGSVNELLFDRTGKVEGVVIGVGGFLGLGERSVAVPYSDLKWSMTSESMEHANAVNPPTGERETAANAPGGPGTPAPGLGNPASPINRAPGMGAMVRAERASDAGKPAAYPDHAILANASKEQLQKAPQFNYGVAPK